MKRRSTNERVCTARTRTRTRAHTSVARVRWQSKGAREMPTRHGETETCTRWKKIEGRGEGGRPGAPVSAFQRRTSAPRLAHIYTHTHIRARNHEHERDPCLTRLASVSSELSNGPVAFPALRTSSPPFVIQSYVRTYVLSTCA